MADRLLAGGRPQSAVRLVMNRVTRDSFGKRASVEDLDECIDTVGAQLIAVIPESVALQQAGAAGTVPLRTMPLLWPGRLWQNAYAGKGSAYFLRCIFVRITAKGWWITHDDRSGCT